MLLPCLLKQPVNNVYSYLGDWANCCAAVTASSLFPTTIGTLLHPGCFRIRSSCRTVRSTVARVQRSTLLMTMKMGTFRAMANPRCSRVVPAVKKRQTVLNQDQYCKKKLTKLKFKLTVQVSFSWHMCLHTNQI